MDIEQAEKVLAHLRDHIASKPPSTTGRKMFDAIQMVLCERERLQKLVIYVRTEHWDEVRAVAGVQGAESLDDDGLVEACRDWVNETRLLIRDWKPDEA